MSDWVSALSGLFGVALGSGLTQMREHRAERKKEKKEVAYLVVLVAGVLDLFSAKCAQVVGDNGLCRGQTDENGYLSVQVKAPTFEVESLAVDWKSLPAHLMYPILDFPYRIELARDRVRGTDDVAMPPDYEELFEQRQLEYAVLGIDAAALAAALRKYGGFPPRPPEDWDRVAYMAEAKSKIEALRKARASHPMIPVFDEPAGKAPDSA